MPDSESCPASVRWGLRISSAHSGCLWAVLKTSVRRGTSGNYHARARMSDTPCNIRQRACATLTHNKNFRGRGRGGRDPFAKGSLPHKGFQRAFRAARRFAFVCPPPQRISTRRSQKGSFALTQRSLIHCCAVFPQDFPLFPPAAPDGSRPERPRPWFARFL